MGKKKVINKCVWSRNFLEKTGNILELLFGNLFGNLYKHMNYHFNYGTCKGIISPLHLL